MGDEDKGGKNEKEKKAGPKEKPAVKTDEGDFDPYTVRGVAQPLTDNEATIQLVKCALGTGCLAMPMAFSHSGYVSGVLITILVSTVVIYSMRILLRSMYKLCKRRKVGYLTYSEAMREALGDGPKAFKWLSKPSVFFVDGFLSLYHFGICSVYIVFIGETMEAVIGPEANIDVRLYMVMLFIPMCIIYSIRTLKHLVPLSLLANILLVVGYACLIVTLFLGLPSLSERIAFNTTTSFHSYAIFLGTVLFALESVGVMIAIEANMAMPAHFIRWYGSLTQGILLVAIIYIFMGFLGYWKYGTDVKGSITLNLKPNIWFQVLKAFFAVAIFFSYPLQGYVPIDIIWNQYLKKRVDDNRALLYEYLTRYTIVLLSVLVAVIFPDFGIFLSLVGSFCLSILGLIFPAVIDICTRYGEEDGFGKLKFNLWLALSVLIFGIIGGAAGTYASMTSIIEYYKK